MEKTFADLKIGDKIFYCSPDSFKYESKAINELSYKGIETVISNGSYSETFVIKGEDIKKSIVRKNGYHHSHAIIFVNESDAIRYCKAQGVKELNRKIEAAKKSIEEVRKFRESEFENLNVRWVDKEINTLERSERVNL